MASPTEDGPCHIIHQENALQTCLQVSLMEALLSTEVPSSKMTLSCVRLTKGLTPHTLNNVP